MALPLILDYAEPYPRATICLYQGHALRGLGDLAGAERAYREAIDAWRGEGTTEQNNESLAGLAGLAELALLRGDVEQARRFVQEFAGGPDTPFRLRAMLNDPLQPYLTCYRAWTAVGDPRAESFLPAAAAVIQQRAATIADPRLRQCFLEGIAAHREIRQLRDLGSLALSGKEA